MRLLPMILLFALIAPTWGQESGNAIANRLGVELTRIREEQQAVYQQFQMLQALQHSENQEGDPMAAPYTDGQPPSYDDAVRAKQERIDRQKYYSEELRRLSDQHRALEARAAAVQQEIRAGAGKNR